MELDKDLTERLDRYASCVGEFIGHGIPLTRQLRGDLKEIDAWCKIKNLEYKPHAKYYLSKCKEYRK